MSSNGVGQECAAAVDDPDPAGLLDDEEPIGAVMGVRDEHRAVETGGDRDEARAGGGRDRGSRTLDGSACSPGRDDRDEQREHGGDGGEGGRATRSGVQRQLSGSNRKNVVCAQVSATADHQPATRSSIEVPTRSTTSAVGRRSLALASSPYARDGSARWGRTGWMRIVTAYAGMGEGYKPLAMRANGTSSGSAHDRRRWSLHACRGSLSCVGDHDRPDVRRPEHVRAAARRAREAARPAFGAAFDDPAHGFLHPVDLDVARREHDAFVDLLVSLGPTVHVLEDEIASPDLVYTFDPLLVTDRGAIPLRPGKPNRAMEPAALEAWTQAAGIPTVGRIEAPGTVEGGDTLWLRPDLFCIGRTLRTNDAGARQLAALVGDDVRVFDVPYWRGPAELIHLMSVISPVADDLAVVFLPLLPVGLWQLLGELGIAARDRARRGVPDARLQRPGGPPGRGHPGRGQSAHRGGARGGRVRGPHVSRHRDRRSTGRAGRPA